MGQKVNPHGARVGVIKDWSTRWYADKKNFADNLVSDAKIRKLIKNLEFTDDKSNRTVKLYDAGISGVEIERRFDNDKVRVTVTINVAKPGIVIGANGANIEKIKAAIVKGLGMKNAQVILKLGRAQGAALTAAVMRGIPVAEYAPRKAKIAICGNGAASKEQVAMMISKTLKVDLDPKYLDATDALAIALCHHYQMSNPLASIGGKSDWKKFLEDNPERIKK